MNKKILDVTHHMCDGCCMWNGIEDIYVNKSGESVPEAFFFALGSYAENAYLKFQDERKPRLLCVGDGRTKKTYDKMKEVLGLEYKISEGRTLEYAKKSVKKEIDLGNPVILGPLDMYHLPYLKMYHRDQIPMHYVLMVGYDEDEKCAYIYDCGREEMQKLPYEDLEQAWQIKKNDVGDKNGFIRFKIANDIKSVFDITRICMKRKATEQLSVKPEFLGISALRKIAREFPNWKEELSEEAYVNALKSLTEFLGTVPKLPNELLEINQKEYSGMFYRGNCDRLGKVLIILGDKYCCKEWEIAGELFFHCGYLYEEITERIINYLCKGENSLEQIPKLFLEIAEQEEKAYRMFL